MTEQRYCTVPKFFSFKEWYENKFSDLCKIHDNEYVFKNVNKWTADWKFVSSVWNRGYKFTAIGSFIAFWTVGLYYWYT